MKVVYLDCDLAICKRIQRLNAILSPSGQNVSKIFGEFLTSTTMQLHIFRIQSWSKWATDLGLQMKLCSLRSLVSVLVSVSPQRSPRDYFWTMLATPWNLSIIEVKDPGECRNLPCALNPYCAECLPSTRMLKTVRIWDHYVYEKTKKCTSTSSGESCDPATQFPNSLRLTTDLLRDVNRSGGEMLQVNRLCNHSLLQYVT